MEFQAKMTVTDPSHMFDTRKYKAFRYSESRNRQGCLELLCTDPNCNNQIRQRVRVFIKK